MSLQPGREAAGQLRPRCSLPAPTRLPRPVAPVGREEPPHGFRTTPSVRPRSRPRLSERRCSGAALWRAPAAPPRPRRVVVRERQLHGASTKFVAFFPSSPPTPPPRPLLQGMRDGLHLRSPICCGQPPWDPSLAEGERGAGTAAGPRQSPRLGRGADGLLPGLFFRGRSGRLGARGQRGATRASRGSLLGRRSVCGVGEEGTRRAAASLAAGRPCPRGGLRGAPGLAPERAPAAQTCRYQM